MSNETITSSLFDGLPSVQPEVANQEAPTQPMSAVIPTEEKAAAPIVEPTPSQPTPTYDPKEIFGEQYDSFDKVKSELEQMRSELQSMQSREPEFANDDLRYINYALKAGFNEAQADTLKGVVTGQLTDPIEIVAAKLQLQYGWDLDRIENYMMRTYKLGEYYDADDPEVQIARDQLEMQSVIDKDYLVEQANKIQVPQYVDPQQIIGQQIEQWKPVIPDMLKANSVIKLGSMEYNVPQETLQQAEKHIMDVLGYDYFDIKSEEQRKGIQDVINKEIVYREFNNIVNYLNIENEKKAIRDKSNVPSPSGNVPSGTTNTEIDTLRHILTQMG